jgi:hypothetical protein
MITKWRVNQKGGLKLILQSDSFKMDGTFKEHEPGVMELQLNEDSKYVFIV